MKNMSSLALCYQDGELKLLDQRFLPHKEVWLTISSTEEMFKAISSLKVRGAPLIGVAAALWLANLAEKNISKEQWQKAAEYLKSSRPTAVNLMVCIDRLLGLGDFSVDSLVKEAEAIFSEDVLLCERIAENGAHIIEDGDCILTHCNTGGLATAGIGTALGIIRSAAEQDKNIHVYVDETRPLLQGARLTTWELEKSNIPYTLICDNMAAQKMAKAKIDKVIVGADRIAKNGDFANKIGTYSLAVLSHYHKIPFYVAAPYTTIDRECLSGIDIPIEQREAIEVKGAHFAFDSLEWAPGGAKVANPAFDVTPHQLVSGWVTDKQFYSKFE